MAESTVGKWGCGCLTVILFFNVGIPLISGVLNFIGDEIKGAKASREEYAERQRAIEIAEEEKKRLSEEQKRIAQERKAAEAAKAKALVDREERLRAFILREAPALWKTYQDLGAQIANQERQIEDLRSTLVAFEKAPEQDADFKKICRMCEEMSKVKSVLRKKIEDVYFACLKFEAMPSREEADELRRRTLEDGILEATSAVRRFNVMRDGK